MKGIEIHPIFIHGVQKLLDVIMYGSCRIINKCLSLNQSSKHISYSILFSLHEDIGLTPSIPFFLHDKLT